MAYTYTDPRWDAAAAQLADHPACLSVWEVPDPAAIAIAAAEEARAAMEERGYNIGVGTVVDTDAGCVLLRLIKG